MHIISSSLMVEILMCDNNAIFVFFLNKSIVLSNLLNKLLDLCNL